MRNGSLVGGLILVVLGLLLWWATGLFWLGIICVVIGVVVAVAGYLRGAP